VRDGDLIEASISRRRIDLQMEEAELNRRHAAFKPSVTPQRGWQRIYAQHVLQAHQGVDLDFLAGN